MLLLRPLAAVVDEIRPDSACKRGDDDQAERETGQHRDPAADARGDRVPLQGEHCRRTVPTERYDEETTRAAGNARPTRSSRTKRKMRSVGTRSAATWNQCRRRKRTRRGASHSLARTSTRKIAQIAHPVVAVADDDAAFRMLLRINLEKAEYWDSPSSTVGYALSFVSSLVTGKEPDPGENRKVNL